MFTINGSVASNRLTNCSHISHHLLVLSVYKSRIVPVNPTAQVGYCVDVARVEIVPFLSKQVKSLSSCYLPVIFHTVKVDANDVTT